MKRQLATNISSALATLASGNVKAKSMAVEAAF